MMWLLHEEKIRLEVTFEIHQLDELYKYAYKSAAAKSDKNIKKRKQDESTALDQLVLWITVVLKLCLGCPKH